MTSELAKQLRDAGFPGSGKARGVHAPTLSELIGACGEYFWSLRRTPEGKWLASGHIAKKGGQVPYYESATYDEPDVALAELYLAIARLHERGDGE